LYQAQIIATRAGINDVLQWLKLGDHHEFFQRMLCILHPDVWHPAMSSSRAQTYDASARRKVWHQTSSQL
jgi:hypothetical protein